MSDATEQLETAVWYEIPTKYTVGIPLAIGTIIFVTVASGSVIRRAVRKNHDQKVHQAMIDRRIRREQSDNK